MTKKILFSILLFLGGFSTVASAEDYSSFYCAHTYWGPPGRPFMLARNAGYGVVPELHFASYQQCETYLKDLQSGRRILNRGGARWQNPNL